YSFAMPTQMNVLTWASLCSAPLASHTIEPLGDRPSVAVAAVGSAALLTTVTRSPLIEVATVASVSGDHDTTPAAVVVWPAPLTVTNVRGAGRSMRPRPG